eukprot:c22997_g2_i1 orf=1-984(-)
MERWQKPEVENISTGSGGDHPSRSSLDYTAPLRSVRGDAASAHSPFYKLSSELSRESLRIPGAVPFMWEQSPGRRKFAGAISTTPSVITPQSLQPQHLVSEIISASDTDPLKTSLASLFQQPSFEGAVSDVPAMVTSPVLLAIPQLAPPPSADHPRSSSARYSIVQRSTPTAHFINNAALHNGDEDATSDATSDAITATAGGISVDDSLALSGALPLASTPREARNFIMDRFLPAAHTIACDSPQTPSRRFLQQPGGAAAITAAMSSRCTGSFREHAAVCAAANMPSPLRYSSVLSTPALTSAPQLHSRSLPRTGSFHGGEEEEEEEE